MKKKKIILKIFSFISALSILFNSFYAPLYVLAQDSGNQSTPSATPTAEPTQTPDPDSSPELPSTLEPTSTPEATSTTEPTSPPSSNEPTAEPTPTLPPNPEPVLGEVTESNYSPTPLPDIAGDDKVSESFAQLSSANTSVEMECMTGEEAIENSQDVDWNISANEGYAQTKEKVKLGVKYVFPLEDKVTLTFKCLPKDKASRGYLKIQKIKVSDLDLPEGVNPYGEWAYDITTEMQDGTFEYDITLPKPENQEAKVLYMEDVNSEVKNIEDEKINQEGDKVKVENLNHFSVYFVTVAPGGINSLEKFDNLSAWTTNNSTATSGTGEDSPLDGNFAKIGAGGYICRDVDATGFQNLLLEFYWKGDKDTEGDGNGYVYIKKGGNCSDTSGWAQVYKADLDNNRDGNGYPRWSSLISINLDFSFSNSNFKIKFKNSSSYSDEFFRVDNFKITGTKINWPTYEWTVPSCHLDLTGEPGIGNSRVDLDGPSSGKPAASYKWTSDYLYLRFRVDGNPGTASNPNNFAWSVLVQNTPPKYQYLITLDGLANQVKILENNQATASNVSWNPILNDPAETLLWSGPSSVYANIIHDTSTVDDHYIILAVPINALPSSITSDSTFYFATATDINNFNKDHLNCYEAPQTGAIKITKDIVPDDSSTWDFTISGPSGTFNITGLGDEQSETIDNLQPGTYSISENTNPNYSTSVVCGGVRGAVGYSFEGDVKAGETLECTFTNTKLGKITIIKDSIPNSGQNFTFTRNFGEDFQLDDDSNAALPNTITFDNLLPDVTYTVTEQTLSGWDLTAINCTQGGRGNINTQTATIDLEPGAEVTCTFENTRRARIRVDKVTDPSGSTQKFDFSIIGGPENVDIDFQLSDTDSIFSTRYTLKPGGGYSVTEPEVAGWDLTSVVCSGGQDPTNIALTPGQTVFCTFTNTQRGSVVGYKYDEDGKTGLDGWKIFLDTDEQNGVWDEEEPYYLSGDDGSFVFQNLVPGNYSVCEEEKDGWQRMHPLGSNCQEVEVTPGEIVSIYFQNRKVVLGLTLTKSNDAVGSLSAGSQINYTLVVKNTGNQSLTGVTIKDAPAGGFTFVAGSGLLEGSPITPTFSGGYVEWYVGVLNAGEEKTLTYKMQTDSTLVAGTYPNLAIATGVYTPYEYVPEEVQEAVLKPIVVEALAVDDSTDEGQRVESSEGTPVNSEVRIVANLSYSTGVGSTGQVLGASTEASQVLPAAGSSTWNLALALLSLIFGFGLKALSVAVEKGKIDARKFRKGVKRMGMFLSSLVLFLMLASGAKSFSDYVYITKLDSYLNKENFYLSYSALSENPISAQFYVRKDGDATWRTVGSPLNGASGQVEVKPSDIYSGDGKYFFKVLINGGTASDETSTTIDRSGPDPVRDYRKEKIADGHYRLHWRNPDNADYDRVKIYRSENTDFTADSSTEVGTVWGTAGSEMTWENAAAPGKEYYFAIRAIDKAGNASSIVADPETQVTAGAVLGEATEAQKAEEVKALPKEKKGEVLGEEKDGSKEEATPEASPSPESEKGQVGGVLGQAINFAKERTKLTLLIALLLGLASYFVSRFLRREK